MSNLTASAKQIWDRHKVVRFIFVGCFNTLLDFILLNILFGLVGLPALVANTISVSIGITISYFLNHRIVFRHPYKYSLKTYGHFFLVTGLSVLMVQNIVIFTFTKSVEVDSQSVVQLFSFNIPAETLRLNIAKALAVLTGAVWNFLLYKYIVFKHKRADLEDEVLIV